MTTSEPVSIPRFSTRSLYLVRTGSLWVKRFSPPSLYSSVSYSTLRPDTDWKRASLGSLLSSNSTL